jgi:nucleoside 2-deoxyribosyltransferase
MSDSENMDINFRLKTIHELILISLYYLSRASNHELRVSVHLIHSTDYDYLALLRAVVKDKVYIPEARKRFIIPAGIPRLAEIINDDEIAKGVDALELLGLIAEQSIYFGSDQEKEAKPQEPIVQNLFLTEEGRRIAERIIEGRKPIFRPPHPQRSTIFVASAFGYGELDLLYENEFCPACLAVGYTPFRVDLSEPSQTITESIIRGIQESECLLADLTFARPSVYFEIGLAHGLGISLILTCREDHYRGAEDNLKVHFDLEQYKISYWNRTGPNEFSWPRNMKLIERLASILGKQGEKKK